MTAARLLTPVLVAALMAGSAFAAQAPLAGRGAPASSFPAVTRPVAPIISPIWDTGAYRDSAHEVPQIVARLKLRPGMTVGDLGAGDGYDTVRLARLLGPSGRVVAEDVDPAALHALDAQAQQGRLSNVVIALGEPQDPRLPKASLDAAVLVHMYHEITHPYAFLYNLAAAMRPGARVGVEELDRPTLQHGTPPAMLRCEFEAVGYRQLSIAPLQGGIGYFAVFAAPASPPPPQRIRACRA